MKQIIAFLVMLCIISVTFIAASAAEIEADLEYLDSSKSVVFWVEWDVETPSVVFISPDGVEFDPMVESEGTSTIMSENSMYYVVENAAAGQWRVRYDKGKNTALDISVHDYMEGIFIQSFVIGDVDGDYLDTEFIVTSEEDISYNYKISAMIEVGGSEIELKSGSARTNDERTVSVNLSSLTTYSGYFLKLSVWYTVNETDITDFAFSDKFSYVNNDLEDFEFDYSLTVQPMDQLVDVRFDDMHWNADSVIVAIFEDDEDEPVTFDEYALEDYDSVQLSYDPAASKIAIEVTVCVDGVNTSPLRKNVTLADFGLDLCDDYAINSVNLPMEYTGFSGEVVSVKVNGYVSELVFTGDGSVTIHLGDGNNALDIEYTDDKGIVWKVVKSIYVDRIAPILNMSQSYDGTVSNTSVINISGTVLDCQKVVVNGNDTEFDSDGFFSCDIALSEGSNTVTVIAEDALGNRSQYVAVITCGDKDNGNAGTTDDTSEAIANIGKDTLVDKIFSKDGYWILIISGVLSTLIIVYAVIFWRKKDKSDSGRDNEASNDKDGLKKERKSQKSEEADHENI